MHTSQANLTIRSEIEDIEAALNWLRESAKPYRLTTLQLQNLELTIEEIVTNIIKYGYKEITSVFPIDLFFFVEDSKAVLRIEDSGDEFDPTTAPLPDPVDDLDEAQIGGLGVFLIRKLLDGVEYKRIHGKNSLTVWCILTDSDDDTTINSGE